MYKTVRFLMIALVLLTVPTACGPTPEPQPTDTLPPTPTPELAAFPLTITDDLSNEVTIEAEPQRIVSMAPNHTQILYAL